MAYSYRVCLKPYMENSPILPEVPPTTAPYSSAMDCVHIPGHLADPTCALWCSYPDSIAAMATSVAHILKCFNKSKDAYYINSKTGCPYKMDICEVWVAAQMLAKTKVVNPTEVMKKAFLEVLHHTLSQWLKEYGLVCHVCKSQPYIPLANREKCCLWALAHMS